MSASFLIDGRYFWEVKIEILAIFESILKDKKRVYPMIYSLILPATNTKLPSNKVDQHISYLQPQSNITTVPVPKNKIVLSFPRY